MKSNTRAFCLLFPAAALFLAACGSKVVVSLLPPRRPPMCRRRPRRRRSLSQLFPLCLRRSKIPFRELVPAPVTPGCPATTTGMATITSGCLARGCKPPRLLPCGSRDVGNQPPADTPGFPDTGNEA